ncbi:murein transglycosylase [Actinoplanes sp. NPDC049599]|uniref:murein transglycosylase n=1 Tax=Actinoplanes sp. NPDC049599 TaxID=3363903 RepID=UPI0037A0B512
MADGQDTSPKRRGQRLPAPHLDGPLGSSGAAPEEARSAGNAPVGSQPVAADAQGVSAFEVPAPAVASDKSDSSGTNAAAESPTGKVGADKPGEVETEPKVAEGDTKPQAAVVAAGNAKSKTAATAAGAGSTEPQATAGAAGSTEPKTASAGSTEPESATVPSPGPTTGPKTEPRAQTGPNSIKAGTKTGAAPGSGAAAGATAEGAAASGGATAKPESAISPDKTAPPNKEDSAQPASTAPSAAALAAASQGRATRVLRRANPVRVARSTARTTSAWAKRPSGRLILPAVIAALLLGAAGTAGVYLVPQALQAVPSPSATPGFGGDAGSPAGSGPALPAPSVSGLPSVPAVGGTLPGVQPPVGGARPADVLTSWAQQTGTKAGIPVVAVQAYGYAELVVGRTTPSCHLTWTTIAAIAKVESSHGSANGAVLNVDGSVAPPIFGLPLDGKGGRQEIRDTDQGALDGDTQFDRAIGPLQFIPQTWTAVSVGNGVDADNSGVSDPNDIDDASLAAARYLCQGGRDLAKPDAWWDAILSYNAIRPYAQKVFEAANDYGQRSRV